MLKTLTWISLGLSILGAIADFGGSGQSDTETAAELALLGQVLGATQGDHKPGDAAPASRR